MLTLVVEMVVEAGIMLTGTVGVVVEAGLMLTSEMTTAS